MSHSLRRRKRGKRHPITHNLGLEISSKFFIDVVLKASLNLLDRHVSIHPSHPYRADQPRGARSTPKKPRLLGAQTHSLHPISIANSIPSHPSIHRRAAAPPHQTVPGETQQPRPAQLDFDLCLSGSLVRGTFHQNLEPDSPNHPPGFALFDSQSNAPVLPSRKFVKVLSSSSACEAWRLLHSDTIA